MQSIQQDDFTLTFSEDLRSDDFDLNRAFNQLNETYKRLRNFRESEHQLLKIIVEHTDVPIICFDERNEDIYLVNNAARNLLGLPFLKTLENLNRTSPLLPGILRNVRDGEKTSFRLQHPGKIISLSISSCHVVFQQKTLKVTALHDMSSELALKEAETWQKLLRVLTHEISNSAIPLSTLSSYLHEVLVESERQKRPLTEEERQDVLISLKTIDQRSRNLKEFVQNFKSLNQVPEPNLRPTSLSMVVKTSVQLFSKELRLCGIDVNHSIPDDAVVYADATLTQQVIINMIKNASESMSEQPGTKEIEFRIYRDNLYTFLKIRDTGAGILAEDIDQIFIPFYSTKKGGSGIGLSISKQIMQRQKGDITVQSHPGKGSEFTLSFLNC